MTDLDHFFEKPQPPSHPKVRYWRSLLENQQVARLRVEVRRERQPFSVNVPRLFVHLYDTTDREVASPEELDWDSRLNDELLELAVPATDRENEARRFGLVLRSRFSIVATRFGDGFFNAVLTQHLRGSGFGKLSAVAEMLDEIHCYHPSPGEQLDLCIEMLESVLGSCIDSLYEDLKYSKEQTIAVMSTAIAAYLDERFSVSERRVLGFS